MAIAGHCAKLAKTEPWRRDFHPGSGRVSASVESTGSNCGCWSALGSPMAIGHCGQSIWARFARLMAGRQAARSLASQPAGQPHLSGPSTLFYTPAQCSSLYQRDVTGPTSAQVCFHLHPSVEITLIRFFPD